MYNLPLLSYDYNELEPFFDAHTLEVHYNIQHRNYVDKLNTATDELAFKSYSLANIFHFASAFPDVFRDNAGGHYNHSLFWNILSPGGPDDPKGETPKAIEQSFGSFEKFKREFETSASNQFGNGWVWLIATDNDELAVTTTPKEDNPLMDTALTQGTPILGLDLWEHAYYQNYQNRYHDYINAFWRVVNWDKVEELYQQTLTMAQPVI